MDHCVTGMVLSELTQEMGLVSVFFPSARDAGKAFHEKYFLDMKGLKHLSSLTKIHVDTGNS